jgi:type VI protein secretion system component VasK
LESVEAFSKNLFSEQTERSVLFPREEVTKQIPIAIERLIVRPILRADLIKMAKSQGFSSTELLDALILHLLLTVEKQSDEPSPQSSRWAEAAKLAGIKARERWLYGFAQSDQLPTSRAPQVVEALVQYYAQSFVDSSQMIDREKRFVNNARSTLLGAGDDPLTDIINDPTMPQGLRARDLLGSAVLLFTKDEPTAKKTFVIRGAFTPAGYEVVKHRLRLLEKAQDEDEDSWILGKERKVRDARSIKRIKDNYFVQYITEWKRFLLSLTLQEPTSLDATRSLLKQLSTDKPFDFIWQNISQNLVLVDESIEENALDVLKNAAEKKASSNPRKKKLLKAIEGRLPKEEQEAGPKQVAAAFDGLLRFGSVKPTGFEQYHQIINEVSAALGPQGAPESKEFHRTIKTARTSLSNLISRYNDMGWEQGMLEKILMPPFRSAEVAVIGASADSANQKWCETVFVAFNQLIAGRYPFTSGKHITDAKIPDIEKFFQPGTGTLWQYYTDSLQSDIEKVGSVFRMKVGAEIRYREEFLRFLSRAQDLTTRLFSKDATKIGFPVAVHIHPSAQYSKIILDIGTKKIIGLNSVERWEEFMWPVRRASIRLFVKMDEVETIGAMDEGEWSLFRLFSRSIGTTKSGDALTVIFPTANNQSRIQIDFKPENLRDLFNKLYLPRSITVGGGACRK